MSKPLAEDLSVVGPLSSCSGGICRPGIINQAQAHSPATHCDEIGEIISSPTEVDVQLLILVQKYGKSWAEIQPHMEGWSIRQLQQRYTILRQAAFDRHSLSHRHSPYHMARSSSRNQSSSSPRPPHDASPLTSPSLLSVSTSPSSPRPQSLTGTRQINIKQQPRVRQPVQLGTPLRLTTPLSAQHIAIVNTKLSVDCQS